MLNWIKKNENEFKIKSIVPLTVIFLYVLSSWVLNKITPIERTHFSYIYPSIFFLASIIFVVVWKKTSIKNFGLKFNNTLNHALVGMVASIIPIVGVFLLWLLIFVLKKFYVLDVDTIFNYGYNPLFLVILILIAPAIEELIFRGFFFQSLLSEMKPVYAIFLSAIIFTAAHMQLHVGAFLLGLATAYIFYLTRSILPCLMLHAVCNSLGVIMPRIVPEVFYYLRFLFN